MTETAVPQTTRFGDHERRAVALLAGVVVVAAALVGWLLVQGGAGSDRARVTTPVLVSAAELRQFAESVHHPVFWAGPRNGTSYELTATASGRVFVRYLPPHVQAGNPRAGFLTVGTYPSSRPYVDLERASRADDAIGIRLHGGALALMSRRAPRSVYLASRGSPYQVEVYAPSLDLARDLVLGGSIRPIG